MNRTFDVDDMAELNTSFETKSDQNDRDLPLIPLDTLKDIGNLTVASSFDNLKITDSPRDRSFRKLQFSKLNPLDDTVSTVIRENLQTPLLEKMRENRNSLRKGRASTANPLDDTVSTVIRANLQTPLIEKAAKNCETESVDVEDDETESVDSDDTIVETRVTKLSNTFITELDENCLVDSPATDDTGRAADAKNQKTPDVFAGKRNEIWRNNSSAKKNPQNQTTPDVFAQKTNDSWKRDSSTKKNPTGQTTPGVFAQKTNHIWRKDSSAKKNAASIYFKSRLPMQIRSPAPKYFKSPVADYIHRGLKVQSMSKLRHSHCLVEEEVSQSKSDNKINKPCRIPISMNAAAKRKLYSFEVN